MMKKPENAMQYYSAIRESADAIITRKTVA